MGGFIKVSAERISTKALNTQIEKEIFHEFKVKCKERGLVINNIIEIFVRQYSNGRYYLDKENIIKWKDNTRNTETLNCAIDETAYSKFKDIVKREGFFIKDVVNAFVEDYAKNDLRLEFVERNKRGD